MAVAEKDLLENPPPGLGTDPTADQSASISAQHLGWWDEVSTFSPTLVTSSSPLLNPVSSSNDDFELACLIARILPIALFHHENLATLEKRLREQVSEPVEPRLREGVICIGVAIALLCQEQACPQTLIPQLFKHTFWSTSELRSLLDQVHTRLQHQASLARVSNLFEPSPTGSATSLERAIAWAIFCWASTPDAFSLTMDRGRSLSSSPYLSTLIACALSGVFNGFSGIPLDLQGALLLSSAPLLRSDILDQADQLLTVWSGCYPQVSLPGAETAVAAPGVLRPRSEGVSF